MSGCRTSHLTALTVIPAQAGIQNPGVRRLSDELGWIPAFAGMTVGGGNDGMAAGMMRCRVSHLTALTVIPAQAGIQNPGGGHFADGQGWIPVFAGMTVGGGIDDEEQR